MIKITGIKLSIHKEESELKGKCSKLLRVSVSDFIEFKILKKSLDARKKNTIFYLYTIGISLKNEQSILDRKQKEISLCQPKTFSLDKVKTDKTVAVVGYGPAGMYAALSLAESGFKVDVYERGEDVDNRLESVNKFWNDKILNVNSNVQFGEGGAGTFSDGKLTSRSKNVRTIKVFNEFIEAGAPEEIAYVNNPHIGTDNLREVVKGIRAKTIKLGANIFFNSNVNGLIIKDNIVNGLVVNNDEKKYDYVILAVGHSARDTFKMLHEVGVEINQKPFNVGYRIEHPQILINQSQYGE